jgi:Ca-activated chloride channel family protein
MNRINKFVLVVLCLFAQLTSATDKASTPYLKILNMDSQIDRVPLLLTTVDANITGLIAEVTITQYFKNDGTVPLEAQYVFPGSKHAAVHQVTMVVGDRVLEAEIQEKQQARARTEKCKT